MKLRHGWLCAAVLLPASALADEAIDYGSIDAFALRASIDAQWPEAIDLHNDHAYGGGLRVMSRITNRVMFTGEFEDASHDGAVSVSEYRIGVGLAGPSTSGAYVTLERLMLDLDNATGLAAHLRLAEPIAAALSGYVDAAYGGWTAAHFYYGGFEITLGAMLDLPKPWGLFADYRILLLDDRDSPERLHMEQFRVGIRYRFDC